MNRSIASLFVALALFTATDSIEAQAYKAGDQVVVVQHGKLHDADGNEVGPVWPGLVIPVKEVKGASLLIEPGIAGWIDAGMVLPSDRRAIERLTTLLQAKPQTETPPFVAAIYMGRAQIRSSLQEYEFAIADCDEAIRLVPAPQFFIVRGMIRVSEKQYDQAISDADEAIKFNRSNLSAFVVRGLAHAGKKKYDKAIEDFDHALRLNPDYLLAYTFRSRAWRALHEYEKAIADCNEALKRDPKFVTALAVRGAIQIVERKYDQALDDLNQALRVDETSYDALYHRGICRVLLRDAEAVADFRRVIELAKGQNEFTRHAELQAYFAMRRLNDETGAQKFLTDGARALKPDEWPAPIIDHLLGKLDEAALLKLADDDDKRTEARCCLGLHALAQDRTRVARDHFRWVVANGNRTFAEFLIAEDELKRLDAAK